LIATGGDATDAASPDGPAGACAGEGIPITVCTPTAGFATGGAVMAGAATGAIAAAATAAGLTGACGTGAVGAADADGSPPLLIPMSVCTSSPLGRPALPAGIVFLSSMTSL
jgi:hypothetical protein